ncbi:hypothetical protein [Peribacillus sp. NPDC097895]|uniref:hypothetical protein n=1 Tax=Peribacillus sp. NPDC097895 TaxID=3390619 RepID=UPI003D07CAA5
MGCRIVGLVMLHRFLNKISIGAAAEYDMILTAMKNPHSDRLVRPFYQMSCLPVGDGSIFIDS